MRALNVLAGVILGLAYWAFVAPLYAPLTARLASYAVPALFGRGFQLIGGKDAILYTPAGLIAARVFMRWITTNVITLIALFAWARRPLAFSNIVRCLVALACLIPIHAIAILVVAKSFVASSQTLWGNAAQAYTIFGAHAVSFALWSLFRPAEDEAAPAPKRRRRKRAAAAA